MPFLHGYRNPERHARNSMIFLKYHQMQRMNARQRRARPCFPSRPQAVLTLWLNYPLSPARAGATAILSAELLPVRAQGIGTQGRTRKRVVVSKQHGEPLNTALRRLKPMGAGTPDPAQRKLEPLRGFTVRAQGIEGARSGRAKQKIHAKHGIFFLA
jgi:hypothetical protein